MPFWIIIAPHILAAVFARGKTGAAVLRNRAVAASVLSLIMCAVAAASVLAGYRHDDKWFFMDPLGAYFALITSLVLTIASSASPPADEISKPGALTVYYALFHSFAAVMLLIPLANNMAVLW